ncbi:MAG: hypothetical protein V4508_01920 [Pseudomonadota bacterium]
MTDQVKKTCNICGRALDNPADPYSVDCGGDCLQCMADSGDPDCAATVAHLNGEPDTTRISSK